MKILGISGSCRGESESGSYKLAKTVLEATGCEYELVSLRGKKILGCTGCLGCVKDNVCVIKDDMADLRDKFVEADALVIAAPNFFSTINATTHALLERLYQFRHREGNAMWGKLAVAVGVGGGDGYPVIDQIEMLMRYSFVETVAKVSGQGAACCFSCGYGETCKVGVVHMMFGEGTKITEDIIPRVEKQPDVMKAAQDAGKELARRLTQGHDRAAVTKKMQEQMMERYKEST
jgi:multimeric flavodoxin WrbA